MDDKKSYTKIRLESILTYALFIFAVFPTFDASYYLRILVVSVGCLISFFSPVLGVSLVLFTAVWWEIPTLLMGYPNQFVIEYLMLGVVVGSMWKFPWNNFDRSNMLRHPVLPFLFLGSIRLLLDSSSIFLEFFSMSVTSLSLQKFILIFMEKIWVWDIAQNPFHAQSVLCAFILQGLFLATLYKLEAKKIIYLKSLLRPLIYGGCVPVFWGIMQSPFLEQFPVKFSNDIGGTFQNGNHLSFFCGLLMFLIPFLVKKVSRIERLWLFFGMMPLLFIGLVLGRGRVALVVFLCISSAIGLLFVGREKKFFGRYGLLSISLLTIFLMSGLYKWSELDEIWDIVSNGSLEQLIQVNGRGVFWPKAMEALSAKPWLGIGYQNFFSLAKLKMEIHSVPLSLLVSFGVPLGLCIFVYFSLSIFIVFSSIKDSSIFPKIFFGMIFYLFICNLADIFTSYQSLFLIICSVFAVMLFHFPSNNQILSYRFLVFVGVATGLAACLSPRGQYVAKRQWSQTKNIFLSAPLYSWKVTPHHCSRLPVRSIHLNNTSTGVFGLYPEGEGPKFYFNLSDYLSYISKVKKKKLLSLSGNHWQNVCICNFSSKVMFGFIYMPYSEYLSFSRQNFHEDHRRISMRLIHPYYYNASIEPSELPTLMCHDSLEIDP